MTAIRTDPLLIALRAARSELERYYRWVDYPEVYKWDKQLDGRRVQEIFQYFKTAVTPPPEGDFDPNSPQAFAAFYKYLVGLSESLAGAADSNVPPPELVKQYEDHLAEEEKRLKEEEAKQPTLAQARIKLLEQLVKRFPQADQTILNDLAREIALKSLDQPAQSLGEASKIMQRVAAASGGSLTVDEIVPALASIAGQLSETNVDLENFSTLVRSPLLEAGLPPQLARTITTTVVAFRLINPQATASDIQRFIGNQTAFLEAAAMTEVQSAAIARAHIQTLASALPTVSQTASGFNLNPPPEDRARQTLAATLARHLPANQATELAGQMFQSRLSILTYAVAVNAPPGDSPEQSRKNQLQAFKSLNNAALDYLSRSRAGPQALVQQLQQLALAESYETYFDAAHQTYYARMGDVQSYYLRRQMGRVQIGGQTNPIMGFFLTQARKSVQDKATQIALDRFAASGVGQALGFGVKAGAKAAATAAGEAALATGEGAVAAAIPGGQLIAVALWAKAAWDAAKAILPAAKKFIKEALVPLGIAAGAAVAWALGFPVIWGAAIGGGATAVASGGGMTVLRTAAAGVTRFSTALVEMAVVEISTTLIIIIVSIPIVIALILFIITNSAYVVAPGTTIGGGIPGPGGAYPRCWPTEGSLSQGPFCDPDPTGSHCTYNSNAIDIANTAGPEVYATHDGTVSTNCGDSNYGNCVKIISPNGFLTLYAHLVQPTSLAPGSEVTAGTQVGIMGSSGNSTGTHLHYELFPKNFDIRTYVPPWSVTEFRLGVNTASVANTCYAKNEGGSNEAP